MKDAIFTKILPKTYKHPQARVSARSRGRFRIVNYKGNGFIDHEHAAEILRQDFVMGPGKLIPGKTSEGYVFVFSN